MPHSVRSSGAPTRARRFAVNFILTAIFLAFSVPASQAAVASQAPVSAPSYADLADLATPAPIVIKAQVVNQKILKIAQAGPVAPGFARALMEAKVVSLIRGEGGIAPRLTYLADLRLDARGKPPKLKKQQVLLFALPGGGAGNIQLLSRHAQMIWTAEREDTVRAILVDLLARGAPPRITDIGDAFHSAGTIAGESETQIFLKTADGSPVSLSILRRPGEPPRWGVSLGEVVDEAARPPERNTLLWYRLACGLPRLLPDRSTRTLAVTDAEAARRDYALVLEGLGTCARNL